MFFLLILVFLPLRLYLITNPLLDNHHFRQTQTATVARNYYQNGFDLFRSELDVFGTGREKYLTMEFPLYQNLVAIFYHLFASGDIWGRVVSVVMGFVAAWYLYLLVFFIEKKRLPALVTTFFFLAVPLNMIYQRDFLIEPTVIAFLLAGFYYALCWIKFDNSQNFILACLLLSLGFIQKGMYGPFLIFPIWFYSYTRKRHIFDRRLFLLLIIPMVVLFGWQWHVDKLNLANGHPYFTSVNTDQRLWNFGLLSDRWSYEYWLARLQQLLKGIFLKPGLFLFAIGIIAVIKRKHRGFWLSFMLGQIVYFLVFFRIQSHEYYQMIMVPPIAYFMSSGLIFISRYIVRFRLFNKNQTFVFSRMLMALILTVFLYKSWLNSQNGFKVDWDRYKRLLEINKVLPQNTAGLLLTPDYDWNSIYTYYPGRKMLLLERNKTDQKKIEELKNQGYDFIVLQDWRSYEPAFIFLNRFPKKLENEEFTVYLLK